MERAFLFLALVIICRNDPFWVSLSAFICLEIFFFMKGRLSLPRPGDGWIMARFIEIEKEIKKWQSRNGIRK